MSELTVAELNPLVNGLQQMTDETTSAGAELSRAVQLDWASGQVSVSPNDLKNVTTQVLPESVADSFMSASANVVQGGVAVFKPDRTVKLPSPDSTDEKGEDAPGIAIPWVVISDMVYKLQGASPELRSALGIEAASSGDDVARLLRENFPNVPEWMLSGGSADLFTRDPASAPSINGLLGDLRGDSVEPPRPSEYSPSWRTAAGAPQPGGDSGAAAACIRDGKWDGLGGHWWGWPFGWQVAISQPCARNLAYVLTGYNGGGKIFEAVVAAIKVHGVSSGLKALCLTWAAAAAIYAAALGLNIMAVNGPKGVRLQGNWPIVGGPGAFIWAIKG